MTARSTFIVNCPDSLPIATLPKQLALTLVRSTRRVFLDGGSGPDKSFGGQQGPRNRNPVDIDQDPYTSTNHTMTVPEPAT